MSRVTEEELLNYDIRELLRARGLMMVDPITPHPKGRAAYFRGRRNDGSEVFIKAFASHAIQFAEQEDRALAQGHSALLAPESIVRVHGGPLVFVFPYCTALGRTLPDDPADAAMRVVYAMAAAMAYGSLSAAYARASLLYVDLDEESFRVAPDGRLVVVDHDNVFHRAHLPKLARSHHDIPTKDDFLPPEARVGGKAWFFSPDAGLGEWYGLYQLGIVLRRWLSWNHPTARLRRALDDPARMPPRARTALARLLDALDAPRDLGVTGQTVVRTSLRVLGAMRPFVDARGHDCSARLAQLLGTLEVRTGRTAASLLCSPPPERSART